MIRSSRIVRLLSLLAALAVPFAATAAGSSAVTIENRSSWDIYELYLSPVDEEEWGPDQLDADVIVSGDSFKLYDIDCDIYDVRLVDEDDDVCIVGAVKLCASKETWRISDRDLLACQALTDE